jgi:hypothetical protein
MGLNVLTPRGQVSLEQERRVIEIWHSHHPTLVYNETPKTQPAAVDAILVRDGVCRAVVETKCREMDWNAFKNTHDEQWLVTFRKILGARDIAEKLCIPLIGFLYLAPDDLLLCARLWDPEAGWMRQFSVQKTETQKNINGGKAIRDNAFINMRGCEQLRMKDDRQQSTDK